MTFVLKPMRPAGAASRAGGFTLRPGITGVTAITAGAVFPDARAARVTRQRLLGGGTFAQDAWQSQLRDGTTAVGVMGYQPFMFIGGGGGAGDSGAYMLCDPSTVDWPSVTRNGRLPWFYGRTNTSSGHFRPYLESVGFATVYDPVAGFDTYGEGAVEVWWPIITGNTVTVITKVPYLWIASDFSFLTDTDVRKRQTESFRFSNDELYGYCLRRYLGADIDIDFGPDSLGAGWTMYAGKADPTTLVCDTFVPIATGAAMTSATVTAATMSGLGFAAWDQVFFSAFYTGSGIEPPEAIPFYADPGDYVDLWPIAPTNVPPPYDMPGVDDYLPGGYLT